MYIIDEIKNFFSDLFCAPKRYDEPKSYNESISVFEPKYGERGLNGRIDEPVYQGENGDCWLLSAILSMSYSQNGAEKFKDSMNIRRDGSVYVSFDGENRTYRISKREIDTNNVPIDTKNAAYSKGDDDMLATELAIEKIVADKNVKTNYSIQNGGNPYYVYKLYNANNVTIPKTNDSFKQALDYAMNNPDSCAMSFGIVNKGIPGLKTGHSYAIKKVDNKTVTFVDPWDSTKEIKMSRADFIKNQNNISLVYANFNKNA